MIVPTYPHHPHEAGVPAMWISASPGKSDNKGGRGMFPCFPHCPQDRGFFPGRGPAPKNMDNLPISPSICLCYTAFIKIRSFFRGGQMPLRIIRYNLRAALLVSCAWFSVNARFYTNLYCGFTALKTVWKGRFGKKFGEGPLRKAKDMLPNNGGFVKCSPYIAGMTRVRPWSPTYS